MTLKHEANGNSNGKRKAADDAGGKKRRNHFHQSLYKIVKKSWKTMTCLVIMMMMSRENLFS